MSRCDLDLWPVNLKSLWYIKRHVIKVCTKFERNRAIFGWIIDNFDNFCTRYVTLWPWPLTSWPWTFTVLRVSRVLTLYKIWATSNNPRLSYWRFSTSSRAILGVVAQLTELSQGCVDSTSPNLVRTPGDHRSIALLFLAAFSNAGGSQLSADENDAKCRTF